MKTCTRCKQDLPPKEFGTANGKKHGSSRCIPCVRTIAREKYWADLGKGRDKGRRSMAKRRANPETNLKLREDDKKRYHSGRDKQQRERFEHMRKEQPFKWRAQLLRRKSRLGWPITEQQLRDSGTHNAACAL